MQAAAEDSPAQPAESPDQSPAAEEGPAAPSRKTPSADILRLTEDYDLWIHKQRKLVIVDGEVCLREGQLEMFACPKGTKEHESVVALNCKSQFIHAALLAVGAKPGHPVQWDPTYRPATGTTIEIQVLWTDENGKRQRVRAQEWVKSAETGKAMQYPWVFAGSAFYTDETTGQRYYQADGGDLICVSNFPSATLDLPVESSQENNSLMYTAFTDNIPPLGTKVRLILIPKLGEASQADSSPKTPDPKPPAPESPAPTGDSDSPG
jgi:hypothetical protein